MPTVDVLFTDNWDFDVDDAIFVVDSPCKAAEAGHVDACVEDGEKGELVEQQKSGNGVVRYLGIYSNTELG